VISFNKILQYQIFMSNCSVFLQLFQAHTQLQRM